MRNDHRTVREDTAAGDGQTILDREPIQGFPQAQQLHGDHASFLRRVQDGHVGAPVSLEPIGFISEKPAVNVGEGPDLKVAEVSSLTDPNFAAGAGDPLQSRLDRLFCRVPGFPGGGVVAVRTDPDHGGQEIGRYPIGFRCTHVHGGSLDPRLPVDVHCGAGRKVGRVPGIPTGGGGQQIYDAQSRIASELGIGRQIAVGSGGVGQPDVIGSAIAEDVVVEELERRGAADSGGSERHEVVGERHGRVRTENATDGCGVADQRVVHQRRQAERVAEDATAAPGITVGGGRGLIPDQDVVEHQRGTAAAVDGQSAAAGAADVSAEPVVSRPRRRVEQADPAAVADGAVGDELISFEKAGGLGEDDRPAVAGAIGAEGIAFDAGGGVGRENGASGHRAVTAIEGKQVVGDDCCGIFQVNGGAELAGEAVDDHVVRDGGGTDLRSEGGARGSDAVADREAVHPGGVERAVGEEETGQSVATVDDARVGLRVSFRPEGFGAGETPVKRYAALHEDPRRIGPGRDPDFITRDRRGQCVGERPKGVVPAGAIGGLSRGGLLHQEHRGLCGTSQEEEHQKNGGYDSAHTGTNSHDGTVSKGWCFGNSKLVKRGRIHRRTRLETKSCRPTPTPAPPSQDMDHSPIALTTSADPEQLEAEPPSCPGPR